MAVDRDQAPARRLLMVAHGQPSEPQTGARVLAALAARVAAELPGWQVQSATLAGTGALERVTGAPGLVFPVFMADGWFTRKALPERLEAAGLGGWQVMQPMGCAEVVQDLAVALARDSGTCELLVAAHGSGRSRAPAAVTEALVARLRAETLLTRVEAAYIEEDPRLSATRGWSEAALCLPFFAMELTHVLEDLPAALGEAGFPGAILPALGLHPAMPRVIARLVRAAAGE